MGVGHPVDVQLYDNIRPLSVLQAECGRVVRGGLKAAVDIRKRFG